MSILVEENGIYCMDCSKAVYATDGIHDCFQASGAILKDVDFLLETEDKMLLVEYKNASIPGAVCPDAFEPSADTKINSVVKKFYDSLHFLTLSKKTKRREYIYILEYPKGDSVSRKAIRNKMKQKLPFKLQESMKSGINLIDDVQVLSIQEWNGHAEYGKYPIKEVKQ